METDLLLEKINELESITKDNILIINIINKRLTELEMQLTVCYAGLKKVDDESLPHHQV